MWRNILTMAVPLILAQAVQVLYNVVDRVYIGHLPMPPWPSPASA